MIPTNPTTMASVMQVMTTKINKFKRETILLQQSVNYNPSFAYDDFDKAMTNLDSGE